MRTSHCALVILLFSVSPLSAQLTRDLQVHTLGIFLGDRFVGGGTGFALRPPGRMRFGFTASAGELQGVFAGRGEAFAAFHLNPGRETGFTPYAATGVAVLVSGDGPRGYLQVMLGLEQRPGRPRGFFAEAGVGGGLRIVAGYRFRTGSGIRRR